MAKAICSIKTCPEPVKARDWCSAHYGRWKRHGDPEGGAPARTPPGTVCEVETCNEQARTRGWCKRHYQIWCRTGDARTPTNYMRRGAPLRERIELRVLKTDKCWYWTGNINRGGYGTIRIGGQTKLAHRVAYEEFVGPIPEGFVVDHVCRNRACVRPDPKHLEPVTHLENVRRGASMHRSSHCCHGHEFTEDNTSWVRHCKKCQREARERARAA